MTYSMIRQKKVKMFTAVGDQKYKETEAELKEFEPRLKRIESLSQTLIPISLQSDAVNL